MTAPITPRQDGWMRAASRGSEDLDGSVFRRRQQIEIHVQGAGKRPQGLDRGSLLATFELGNVSLVESSRAGELGLRETAPLAQDEERVFFVNANAPYHLARYGFFAGGAARLEVGDSGRIGAVFEGCLDGLPVLPRKNRE